MDNRTPVICGIGLSDYPKAPHLDDYQHHAQAMQRALADAGLKKSDLDGYVAAQHDPTRSTVEMAEYLRIDHRFIDGTMVGGSSFEFDVQHAASAIRQGLCETVLVTYGSDLLSKAGRNLGTGGAFGANDRAHGAAQYEAPYGNNIVGAYAMAARRHMHEYGTTSEQLAEVAVGVREFAAFNPLASHQKALSVDDVLGSRLVADPLHLLDCCVVTDGGGAFIMTTAERARDLRQPPIYVLAAGGAQTHWNISQMPDLTETAAARFASKLWRDAGITPADIDVVQLYDSFTITVLLLLEGFGFVPRGESGPFAAASHLRPGGSLPLNTDGGGLSSCHPGMRGIFLVIEAVRQLRHHAGDAQVPDARTAFAGGSGGRLSCIGGAVLSTELVS